MQYTVVIPVLNERENLKKLLPELIRPGCTVLVCDNGSTDGTQELMKDSYTQGVRLSSGSGTVSDAIVRGLKEAPTNLVVVMDGDGSHPASKVREFAESLIEHDMVVGSRYLGGGSSHDTLLNRIISFVGNAITILLAPGIKDRMSGFFGIRKSSIRSYDIGKGIKPMLHLLVTSKLESVSEVPYKMVPRTSGKSSNSRLSSFGTLYELVALHFRKYSRFVKYGLVGGSGVVVGEATLYFFTDIVGFYYMISAVASLILANLNNFAWNNIWTFKDKGHERPLLLRFGEFFVFYGSTAALDMFLLWFFTSVLGIYYLLSFLVAIIIVSVLRFFLSYMWVWGKGSRSISPNMLWNLGHDNDEADFDWWEWYGIHPVKRKWKRAMGNFVKELAGDPQTVLSLGCGCSPLNNLFKGELFGVDLNEGKIAFIRRHSPHTYVVGDITKFMPPQRYECVICTEVVEHLPTPDVDPLIAKMCAYSTKRVVVSFPDYTTSIAKVSEGTMHGDFHSPVTSASLTSMFEVHGYRLKGKRNYKWDTALCFERSN